MAVVWPSKNNFANGDVLTAANMNNIADTLNVFNPTSATNGQVWTANGSGSGSFATPVSGGWTLINSGTMSGSTITSSTFSGYNQIHIDLVNMNTSAAAAVGIRVNGLSTSIYGNYTQAPTSITAVTNDVTTSTTSWLTDALAATGAPYSKSIDIYNANQTTGWKVGWCITKSKSATVNQTNAWSMGYMDTAAALTSVTLLVASGTFSAGNYYIYGLK